MAKRKYPIPPAKPVIRKVTPCDACHVAVALFEVVTRKGYLYLCGHHKHAHEAHMAAQGYTVRKLPQ